MKGIQIEQKSDHWWDKVTVAMAYFFTHKSNKTISQLSQFIEDELPAALSKRPALDGLDSFHGFPSDIQFNLKWHKKKYFVL